jgi:hypothetical protein
MTLVGVPEHAHPSPSIGNAIFRRRTLAGLRKARKCSIPAASTRSRRTSK